MNKRYIHTGHISCWVIVTEICDLFLWMLALISLPTAFSSLFVWFCQTSKLFVSSTKQGPLEFWFRLKKKIFSFNLIDIMHLIWKNHLPGAYYLSIYWNNVKQTVTFKMDDPSIVSHMFALRNKFINCSYWHQKCYLHND